MNFLDLPAQAFFIVSSILIYGLLFLSYPKKYGYIINLSYIALIYLQSYSLVRSSLILSCVLFIIFKISSKYSLTVIVILLAILGFTIHKTAFFYIPVFLLSKFLTLNVLLKIRYILIALVIPCFLFRYQILDFFFSLPAIDWLGYRGYLSNSHFLQKVELGTGLGFFVKLYLLVLPLLLIRQNKIPNNVFSYLNEILIVGVIALVLSVTIMIFDRVYLALIICYPIAIYMVFTSLSYQKALILVFPFLLFLLFFFELSITKQTTDKCDSLRVSPYISIFNKLDDKSLSTFYCDKV